MTFGQYHNSKQINENWLYTIAQVIDPTGVLSYGDLVKATQTAATNPSTVNIILWALAAFAAMPNLGLLAAGVGGVPWAAAKAAARGAAKNPKLLEKAGSSVVGLLRKEPGKTALNNLVTKMVGEKVITNTQAKALLGTIEKGAKFRLTKADIGALEKGAKGAGTFVKTAPEIAAAGSNVAGNILKQIPAGMKANATLQKGTKLKTAARLTPAIGDMYNATTGAINTWAKNQTGGGGDPYAPQTEPGEEVVTYTDPRTGKQIQTTRQALQDAGIAPLDQPQQPVYTFGGRALTPAQAAALGQFATPRIPGQPGQRGTPGTLMPQNVPQGATQENPFGRQNMAPQQFMRPDNFNNPPNFFSRPQTYNPNNQNQYGNQYGNPNDNQYGGNVFGGITSQMAGTPAAGMANLASGLIGVLPGLAGGGGANIGMNLLGMLPGLMGGV
jgi:hypothetical protein